MLFDEQHVTIRSSRGAARARLCTDASVPSGTAFMPIHWNELFSNGASPNEATTDASDQLSKQPSLKYCAVRIEADVSGISVG